MFKIVSTGQKVGNLNEEPKLRIFPETNRFKLNVNGAKAIGVSAGDGVTILADTDEGLYAIHKAIPKLNSKGKVVMKPVKMTEAQKEELTANGEAIPEEIDYQSSCKLGKHLEFSSGNAVAQTGVEKKLVCGQQEVVKGKELGIDAELVAVYSYVDAKVDESGGDENSTIEEVEEEEEK